MDNVDFEISGNSTERLLITKWRFSFVFACSAKHYLFIMSIWMAFHKLTTPLLHFSFTHCGSHVHMSVGELQQHCVLPKSNHWSDFTTDQIFIIIWLQHDYLGDHSKLVITHCLQKTMDLWQYGEYMPNNIWFKTTPRGWTIQRSQLLLITNRLSNFEIWPL